MLGVTFIACAVFIMLNACVLACASKHNSPRLLYRVSHVIMVLIGRRSRALMLCTQKIGFWPVVESSEFKSPPIYWLCWMKFFIVSLSPSRRMSG